MLWPKPNQNKTNKQTKIKESVRNYHSLKQPKEAWQVNVIWYHECFPRTKTVYHLQTKEIWTKYGQMRVFLTFNISWKSKTDFVVTSKIRCCLWWLLPQDKWGQILVIWSSAWSYFKRVEPGGMARINHLIYILIHSLTHTNPMKHGYSLFKTALPVSMAFVSIHLYKWCLSCTFMCLLA